MVREPCASSAWQQLPRKQLLPYAARTTRTSPWTSSSGQVCLAVVHSQGQFRCEVFVFYKPVQLHELSKNWVHGRLCNIKQQKMLDWWQVCEPIPTYKKRFFNPPHITPIHSSGRYKWNSKEIATNSYYKRVPSGTVPQSERNATRGILRILR